MEMHLLEEVAKGGQGTNLSLYVFNAFLVPIWICRPSYSSPQLSPTNWSVIINSPHLSDYNPYSGKYSKYREKSVPIKSVIYLPCFHFHYYFATSSMQLLLTPDRRRRHCPRPVSVGCVYFDTSPYWHISVVLYYLLFILTSCSSPIIPLLFLSFSILYASAISLILTFHLFHHHFIHTSKTTQVPSRVWMDKKATVTNKMNLLLAPEQTTRQVRLLYL